MSDDLRAAIQAVLDTFAEGWSLSHFIIPMGVERVVDGEIEATVWLYEPPWQAPYITSGLLLEADSIQHAQVEEDP